MPSLNTGNAILSNPIKVDSSYNVGIGGAASGSFKLQVTGTTNLTGALTGTSGTFSGAFTLATTSGVLAVNTTGRPAGVGGGDNGKIWSKQATTGNYGIATIASATDSFTYIGHNGTDALLGTSYGTTGAYTDLVIQTADVTRFRLSGSTGAATFSAASGGAITLTTNGSANNWTSAITGNSTTSQSYGLLIQAGTNSTDGALRVRNQANNADWLFVRGDGNVGIGTTTPADLLTLYRNGNQDNTLSIYQGTGGYASTLKLVGANDDGARYNNIGSYTNGGNTHWLIGGGAVANTMVFYTNNNTRRMQITPEGYFDFFYNGTTNTGAIVLTANDMLIGGQTGKGLKLCTNNLGQERIIINVDGRTWIGGAISGLSGSGVLLQVNGQTRLGGTTILHNGSNVAQEVRLSCNGAASFFIDGALSKNSGSFRIDHPLESMTETHQLVHSFVESPQANNIYRGKIQLENGFAQVNLDEVSTMTEGTFIALNREIHTYTSNETDWDAVRGKVQGNILTIECQNNQSNAIVSWLVIGERHDKHMMDTEWTDDNGRVIVEPLKPIQEQDNNNK